MTLTRRGRACQRTFARTVVAALRLAPSWSRRHPGTRRKTHPLNFRSTWYQRMAYFLGFGEGRTRWVFDYRENCRCVFFFSLPAGNDEVVGCSFDAVCNWFSYPASATPYTQTHMHMWNRNRDGGREEGNFDVFWPHPGCILSQSGPRESSALRRRTSTCSSAS